jgi:hypothetical protein
VLVAIQVAHVRHVGRERRAALAPVEHLFTDAVVAQDGIGYPRLRGRYRGDDSKVDLIVDALALRELPALWLFVDVMRPVPVRTPVDIVLRPRTSDIVSPGRRFGYEHARPEGWPQDIRIATREPGPLPDLGGLEALRPLLEDPRTKALLVAPGGVRIVHELQRGSIGAFRVTRRASFDAVVTPERLVPLLAEARAIADRIGARAAADVREAV